MVSGKIKAAMGFHKASATPKAESNKDYFSPSSQKQAFFPPSPPPPPPSRTVFSRSFGVYFPRSTQIQPRPPDAIDLVRLVEELQERECRLKTQLLEQRLPKETAAAVPFLEKELASKNAEIERSARRIERLEAENQMLRREVENLTGTIERVEMENEKKVKEMEEEIADLKKVIEFKVKEMGALQKFHKSNQAKCLKKGAKSNGIHSVPEKEKTEIVDLKGDIAGTEELHLSRCNGDISESSVKPKAPRVPKPPPRPSFEKSRASFESTCLMEMAPLPPPLSVVSSGTATVPPPPPPPPPPARLSNAWAAKVRRVPEVVELYRSLMRRESKRDSSTGVSDAPGPVSARDMIGEIETRSAHLLAIKTDVETQGDFIRFLIKEVQNAAFTGIEDLVNFVKWLDDELSFLVDERAVLKHFEWPEHKADAMREAAFGYCDLKKLESEASSFCDEIRQPCGPALKKMQSLLEKLEHGVYNLSRMREAATERYKGFGIPWEWMLESGYVSQIKLASVKLAKKYMKRVSAELETAGGGPDEEELMRQGVRFAFRVHQFAGGFDVETMRAFQELRNKSHSCHILRQNQHQQQHKLICRSTSC